MAARLTAFIPSPPPLRTTFTVTLASSPANTSGSTLIPRLTGGYNVINDGGSLSILIQHSGNHNLEVGDSVQIKFLILNPGTPAQSAVYTVASVNGPNSFRVTSPSVITNGSQGSGGMVAYPLKASQWNRSGTATVDPSTWSVGSSDGTLNQTPLDSNTVFNFFYPDYQLPGEMAKAGMTTPEFQLTNDSNTMILTNAITQGTVTNNGGNLNGYIAFFGSNAVTMDLGPYMTAGQTSNAAIPALWWTRSEWCLPEATSARRRKPPSPTTSLTTPTSPTPLQQPRRSGTGCGPSST